MKFNLKMIGFLKISLVITCILGLQLASAQPADSKVELTILHTNDYHGRLEPFDIIGQEKVGGEGQHRSDPLAGACASISAIGHARGAP